MEPPPPLFLAGPTSVGKSAVALILAELVGGEIISVDSMQVYRGMDLGTAKPSREERRRVPHHLIDVADLNQSFDAAQFVHLAGLALNQIQRGGRIPIFCGGTGLYFKAFLEGLGVTPPPDPAIRAELEAKPLAELLVELEHRDPATFQTVDRQNRRRLIRALEIVRLTGESPSRSRAGWADPDNRPSLPLFFGLTRQTADLTNRIHQRVDAMFARGLVAETQQLLKHGLDRNPTAMQAIGYRQVVEFLKGQHAMPDTILLVKQRTRQFAKRQMTWFRRQFTLDWQSLDAAESPGITAERLAEAYRRLAQRPPA